MKTKLFWARLRLEVLIILIIVIFISLVIAITLSIRSKCGFLLPMTERDIVDLINLPIRYSISPWWNILFADLFAALIYCLGISDWLRNKLGGRIAHNFFYLCDSNFRRFLFCYFGRNVIWLDCLV